jgi:hypothetical protein
MYLMAKEEKAAEEARATEAEKEALAAKMREEEVEDEARIARLQPAVEDEETRRLMQPEAISRHASPEKGPFPAVPLQQSSASQTTQKESSATDPVSSAEDIWDLEAGLDSSLASHMQLMSFRADATKIAEEFLIDHGVKLAKGQKRGSTVRDRGAYEQGKKDGKTIDVHQKMIKEEPAWEKDVATH